jgi:hypothetical protein
MLLSATGVLEAGIPLYRNGSEMKLELGIRVFFKGASSEPRAATREPS